MPIAVPLSHKDSTHYHSLATEHHYQIQVVQDPTGNAKLLYVVLQSTSTCDLVPQGKDQSLGVTREFALPLVNFSEGPTDLTHPAS